MWIGVVAEAGRGCSASCRIELGCLRDLLPVFLHVFGLYIFDMGGDAPQVSEGILDEAGAISVELVLNRLEELRALCGCALHDIVDVGEVDVEAHRTAADGGGP